MKKQTRTTRNLLQIALMTALTAVCSQIQIPLGVIPMNLALFAVYIAGGLLGPALGGISLLVYMLLAAVGAPVLTGLTGGIGILLGRTGGFVVGYVAAAYITGCFYRHFGHQSKKNIAGMTLSCLSCYLLGCLWYSMITGVSLQNCLMVCVVPFIPGDGIKIVLAYMFIKKIVPILKRENRI